MIVQYPSIAAILAAYRTHCLDQPIDPDVSWFGGESRDDTLRLTAQGDTSLVAEAEAQIAALDLAIETPRHLWTPSPAGPLACIPDVLAGLPTPMRRRVEAPDERAPLTILCTTTCSAGVPAQVLRQRGATILALTMALARVRPITLHALSFMDGQDGTGETVFSAAINTTPLDIATAAYVLSSAGFTRRLTYGLGHALNGFTGSWPSAYTYGRRGTGGAYCSALPARLGHDPAHTLMIGPAELHDPLLTDPLEWIKTQVTRFTSQEQDT